MWGPCIWVEAPGAQAVAFGCYPGGKGRQEASGEAGGHVERPPRPLPGRARQLWWGGDRDRVVSAPVVSGANLGSMPGKSSRGAATEEPRRARSAPCASHCCSRGSLFESLGSRDEGELGPAGSPVHRGPPSRQAVRGAPGWCSDVGAEWGLGWAPGKPRWAKEVRHPRDPL